MTRIVGSATARRLTYGTELEGAIDQDSIQNGTFHEDGSVEVCGCGDCDGSCRDYCECRYDCECEECQVCEHCECSTDDCECDVCRVCYDCGENVSDEPCACSHEFAGDCGKKTCTSGNMCSDCLDVYWDNNSFTHSCEETVNRCDFDCGCECNCSCDCCNDEGLCDGEVVSPPLKYKQLESWVLRNYPEKTNLTCGGHLHIGNLSIKEYSELMEEEFYEYFLRTMKRWGKSAKVREGSAFWTRLREGNSYCRPRFRPQDQVDMDGKDSDRYTQLNYCWSLHKTLEVRMLPAFQKKELYVKCVYATIACVTTYLARKRAENYGDSWKHLKF